MSWKQYLVMALVAIAAVAVANRVASISKIMNNVKS
jgi:hypothetical protein